MTRWIRHLYQPGLPLGEDGRRVTGSPEHIELSRRGATEGMVLLKNENRTLPVKAGSKVALFGKGTVDYVKGGGGSGDVTVKYVRNFYEGMKIKEAEGKVSIYHDLVKFYEEDIKSQYDAGRDPGIAPLRREFSDNLKFPVICFHSLRLIRYNTITIPRGGHNNEKIDRIHAYIVNVFCKKYKKMQYSSGFFKNVLQYKMKRQNVRR